MPNSINRSFSNNDYRFYKTKPIILNAQAEPPKSNLSNNQKLGIQVATMLGVISAIALLAKLKGYSLNVKKIFSTPFKDTFLGKEDYEVANVMTIGAGSCLGGYLGGLIFDPNKNNKNAKKREAIMQYTNISLPIATVALFRDIGDTIVQKGIKPNGKHAKLLTNTVKAAFPIAGLMGGMYAGNKAVNKINQKIFKTKDNRPVEVGDFSAHLDDICITSKYIAGDNFLTKVVSRFVPIALMIAGNEIGTKQEKDI